jgi:hypothetical protein
MSVRSMKCWRQAADWEKDNALGNMCCGFRFHWTFPNEVDTETIVRAWCGTVNNARPHEIGRCPVTSRPPCRTYSAFVLFLLGDTPASEFYVSTFRNTLPHLYRPYQLTPPMKMEQSVTKRRQHKIQKPGNHPKINKCNIQNRANVWNQKCCGFVTRCWR